MNEEIKKILLNFFSKYPLLKYKKGEIVFKPGQDFGGIFFVKNGFVRAYTLSKEGKETSIQMFRPLFYFSLISQLTGTKNRYFFESIGNVEVFCVPKIDFVKYLNSKNSIRENITELVFKKFLNLSTGMLQIIGGDAQIKILSLIFSLSDEFGVKKGNKVVIKFKITHKLIASITGLTRETVTLQMLKLEKEGLIDNNKREIVILNMKKITKMLGY
jgi:CRP/FNR family transcriptional regulator